MIKFNLAERVRRPSKRPLTLPKITTTGAQASNLAAIYMRVVLAWTAASPAIVTAYAQTLSELQTDSADDIRSAMDAIQAEMQRIVLMLTPDLREWAVRIERVHRGKWVQSILSAADIDLNTVLTAADVDDTVQSVIEWNVSLVRDVSEETRRRIANSIFAGIQQRKPANDVAKEISEAVGMARARARRIASHQTVNFGERLNEARRRQAGIDTWKWRSSHKLHYRPEHQERDNKIYTDKTAPADRPGMLPNCGCTGQAIVTFD